MTEPHIHVVYNPTANVEVHETISRLKRDPRVLRAWTPTSTNHAILYLSEAEGLNTDAAEITQRLWRCEDVQSVSDIRFTGSCPADH
jgi:hypothetical protein